MLIHGSCHCRNLTFALAWEPAPTEIVARACGCSFCRKHGGVWTGYAAAVLRVAVEDPVLISPYTFETRTAEFQICARCGAVPIVTTRIDDHVYAVVSVNAFDDVDPAIVRHVPASFDDESLADRLARRQRYWIANVAYAYASAPSGPRGQRPHEA